MRSPPPLSSLSLPSETLSALSEAGLTSASQLLSLSLPTLTRLTSLSSSAQHALHKQLYATYAAPVTLPPCPLSPLSVTPSLDKILRGGIPSQAVTQLAGSSSSGKTQTALSIAASTLKDGGGVVWLESCCAGAVRARLERILMAKGIGKDSVEGMLERLVVLGVSTYAQAVEILDVVRRDYELLETLKGERDGAGKAIGGMRLLVFDSVASVIWPMLGLKNGDGWTGHVGMGEIAQGLRWFAGRDVCVVVTNRVVKREAGVYAALGRYWEGFVDVCLTTERKGEEFQVQVKWKNGARGECRVRVVEGGVIDV